MSDFLTVVACTSPGDAMSPVLRTAQLLGDVGGGHRLFVAHAVRPPAEFEQTFLYPLACLGDDRDAIHGELVRSVHKRLLKRIRGDVSGPFEPDALRVVMGEPADALQACADTLGPDLLVVGAQGSRRPEPGRIGGTVSRLAAVVPWPVLVVRTTTTAPVLRSIVCALDLGPDSRGLLEYALGFAARVGGSVTPVHVTPTAQSLDHAQMGSAPSPLAKKDVARHFTRVESSLELSFPLQNQRDALLGRLEIGSGDPGPELVAAAERSGAELIVVGRCRSGGSGLRLGRVAEYVLRHAECPVLVVPPIVVPESTGS